MFPRPSRPQILVGAFVVFHAAFSLLVLPALGAREVYPLFNWELYSRYGEVISDCGLSVKSSAVDCELETCVSAGENFRVRNYYMSLQNACLRRVDEPEALRRFLADLHPELRGRFPGATLTLRRRSYLPQQKVLENRLVGETVLDVFDIRDEGIVKR